MELLLLGDIKGVGEQYEIVRVTQDVGIKLLSQGAALNTTPSVRRRFADQIRKRALASATS